MSASTGAEPGPGGRLGGRYRLLEPIGAGGMGRVYHAHDEVLDRAVAVKLLDAGPAGGADLGPACAAEARAAAGLAHPGIARVFDSGVQDGRCFVVMELVSGRPLAELLRDRGALPALEAAELAARVADALEAAHRQGVIHCDVKPQNIIVAPDGDPKLIDFGIARAVSATTAARPDEVMGSAPYLAPEQARGERLDARTDVYALGAVLYESLVGRPPFTGRSAAEIIAQKLTREPVAPRSLAPTVPPELERAALAALAAEPARRYRSAGEFRDALRGAASDVAAAARARTAPLRPPMATGHPAARREARSDRPIRLRWDRAGLAAAAAILLAGAAIAAALAGRSPSQGRVAPQGAAPALTRPADRPTPPPTDLPVLATTPAPMLAPTGRSTGGEGNQQTGEAEREAQDEARKKAEEAAKKAEEERKKAQEEAKKKAEEEHRKAEEKGQRGGRN